MEKVVDAVGALVKREAIYGLMKDLSTLPFSYTMKIIMSRLVHTFLSDI